MKHVSYCRGVEYAEAPPSLSVDVAGGIAYLRFRRDVEAVERTVDGEPSTTYRATEYVASCAAIPGLAARVSDAEAAWFEAAHGLAVDALSADARSKRDALLVASDPRALADFSQTAEQRAEWMTYRQALRNVPEQAGFPFDVVWPVAPGDV